MQLGSYTFLVLFSGKKNPIRNVFAQMGIGLENWRPRYISEFFFLKSYRNHQKSECFMTSDAETGSQTENAETTMLDSAYQRKKKQHKIWKGTIPLWVLTMLNCLTRVILYMHLVTYNFQKIIGSVITSYLIFFIINDYRALHSDLHYLHSKNSPSKDNYKGNVNKHFDQIKG